MLFIKIIKQEKENIYLNVLGKFKGKNGVIILCIEGMMLSFLGSVYVYYEGYITSFVSWVNYKIFFFKNNLKNCFENYLKKLQIFKKQRKNSLLQKNNIVKRYYSKSNYVLGKEKMLNTIKIGEQVLLMPIKLVENIGEKFIETFTDAITKNNVSKEIKNQNNLSNTQFFNFVEKEGQKTVKYDHRGIVKGVKVNEDKSVELKYFETITSKSNHKINLDLSNEEVDLLKEEMNKVGKGIKLGLPTISMPENKPIKIENFIMNYKGVIKTPVIDNKIMLLDEKNVMKMPKGLGKELQERTKGFMEVVGWKEYEFFYKGKNIYGVHKNDIYRIGEMIMHVDITKAKPVTLGDYAKMSLEIANNPAVNKFINIDSQTKEIYEKNYKILKDLKKD